MSLDSPRFNTSKKLINAAANTPISMGAKGRSVHLVQMALIDLGYAMPLSTKNISYSPDGIFGNETKAKLMEFQNANNINPSGMIDRNTMLALDHFCREYKHQVSLHFRSISLTNVPFSQSLANTEYVYGQYGIKIQFASGMSLMMSEAEEETFNEIDQECNWIINDGQYNQLHSMGGSVPPDQVLVYYVRKFKEKILGCGGHAVNRPACTVAAAAYRWDTPHEIGHVLLTSEFAPHHITDNRNLMFEYSRTSSSMPVLTDRQITKMRQHVCCVAI